jgi:hypothetical protein
MTSNIPKRPDACTAQRVGANWQQAGKLRHRAALWTARMNDEVLINGRFLTRSATGVDRFAFELLRAWWPLFGQRRTVSVAMPRGGQEATKVALGMPVQPDGRTGGHLWEQFELPQVR